MANKPSRPKPKSAPATGAPAPATPPRRSLLWLWVALGAIVLIAAGFAVISGGGDNTLAVGSVPQGAGGSAAPAATDASGSAVPSTIGPSKGEVWPVTVAGTPLDPFPSDGSADPSIGKVAPTLTGFTFDGSPVSYDVTKGPVMLVFIAHWCPHCNREVPELLKWKADGKVPAGLQVVGVTTAVAPDRPNYPPSTWIESFGWPWPVLADSQNQDAAVAMGLTSFPYVVIIGTDGKVITRWAGEKGEAGIQALLDAALA
jgi:cytochrome c biogenesis protein CcmG/thiol:disulfide interchange protein DsbE